MLSAKSGILASFTNLVINIQIRLFAKNVFDKDASVNLCKISFRLKLLLIYILMKNLFISWLLMFMTSMWHHMGSFYTKVFKLVHLSIDSRYFWKFWIKLLWPNNVSYLTFFLIRFHNNFKRSIYRQSGFVCHSWCPNWEI